jgi:hypothetical protein
MLQTRVVLGLVLVVGSIVVAGNLAVNLSSVHDGQAAKRWSDGSPMPIPKPKGDGTLVADGSPMPIPKPKGGITQLV